MNSGDDKFYQNEALVDYDGPRVANFNVDLIPVAKAWRSYVMHCGDAAKTRFVCTNFKRVGPNECTPCKYPGFNEAKYSPKNTKNLKN